MKVGTKGRGPNIVWVDEDKLDLYQSYLQVKKQNVELKQQNEALNNKMQEIEEILESIKLQNIEVVKGLISR